MLVLSFNVGRYDKTDAGQIYKGSLGPRHGLLGEGDESWAEDVDKEENEFLRSSRYCKLDD